MINYEHAIIVSISIRGYCDGTQLRLAVMTYVNPQKYKKEEYLKILDDCIKNNKIVPLLFTSPNSATNVIYFLAGTEIKL